MTMVVPLTAEVHDDWLSLWWDYLDFYETELSTEQTAVTFARLSDASDDGMHGAIATAPDGQVIGLVHWLTHTSTWSARPYCYLEDLYVRPGARGGGAGAALIEHVRQWAERAGCDKVYWLTQQENRRARALYDRVARHSGFVQYELDLPAIS